MAMPCFLLLAALLICPALAFSNDLCAKYGEWTPVAGISAKNFCSTTGIDAAATEKCMLLYWAGKAFTHDMGDLIGEVECTAVQQVAAATLTHDGRPIPVTLTEQRPLPQRFSDAILGAEGATYHFWWKQAFNLGHAASCAATSAPHRITLGPIVNDDPAKNWIMPPGWHVHSVVWARANSEAAAQQLFLPLAAVMRNNDTVAVIIRSTETQNDWITDFSFSQAVFSGPVSWPGQTHEGFSKLAAFLWTSGVQAALDELVLAPGSSVRHAMVSGHSMGAGVGTLLAYTMQTYLTVQQSQVRVDAMLFAPPNVGNAAFAAAFGSIVNARRLPFETDLVPQLPCSPTVTTCLQAWPGALPIALGVWEYASIPGTVMLTAASMPMQQEAWASFGQLYACQLGRLVLATHSCSYNCFLSQFVQGAEEDTNSCLLWGPRVPGQRGSYCLTFPVPQGGVQYPYA